MADLGNEYPIIFSGYSISDPHIQKILFDLTDSEIKRPPFYYIAPHVTEIEKRYWGRHNVFAIDCSFEDFLSTIDQEVSPLRALSPTIGGGTLSIRKHYRVANPAEASSLVSYITRDVDHIHSGLVPDPQDPRQFYRGYDSGWGCIVQNLDVARSVSDSVLVDAILVEEESRSTANLCMLKGPGGNGKSIALKRIAWESGVTYGKLALYVTSAAGLRIEPISEIHRLTGERVFLFVDHVALLRSELLTLLKAGREKRVPLSIVGTERDNEWNIYCEDLEAFVSTEFPVRYLSEKEVGQLLDLLERHNALGALEQLSYEERVDKFVTAAQRQLLVALHELTLGVPFQNIVVDEFRRIEPAEARHMYLDICALHQFGAPVRAGLISRCSGIRFEEFQRQFIKPLENVVHVEEEKHSRDVQYKSRHPHVAEIVFNGMLPRDEDKFEAITKVVSGMNIDYTSDWGTFERLIRGREVARIFSEADFGRLFYTRIQQSTLDSAFVAHQRAIFEMSHPEGSLDEAQIAADRAFELDRRNYSIRHTQSEIARRLANRATDPLRKKALRRSVREKLDTNSLRLSQYDLHTRARVAMDELREMSEALEVEGEQPRDRTVVEVAKEAESAIQRGLQSFPESTELLTVDAEFKDLLDESDRAQGILETAFAGNPGQEWLAVRLARRYSESGNVEGARKVLEACLHVSPGGRMVHLELGRLLSDSGQRAGAIEHLRRSFIDGDNNFEGQFWYARELFIQGHFDEAQRRFDTLDGRATGRFRRRPDYAIRENGKVVEYEGRIVRKEEGYSFLKFAQFPSGIFASRSDSDGADWDLLWNGDNIICRIGFNRRGPRATNIRPVKQI